MSDGISLQNLAIASDRFWGFLPDQNGTECWPWQGGRNRQGYGRFKINGLDRLSHRMAYRLARGEIGDGLLVCHACDEPSCCNPSHLFLGTQRDNIIDAERKGRMKGGARERVKTHCPSGHPYDAINTRVYDGRRYCRECLRIRQPLRRKA